MAKGDRFNVVAGDEIELSFQFNLKRADLAKRNDADKLTHVSIEFSPRVTGNVPTGNIQFTPLSAGAEPDGTKNEVLPITSDDPKFVRLYRVGIPTDFNGRILDDMLVRVSAKLVPKEGEIKPSAVPNDPDLCDIFVRSARPAK